ncbi:MAG: DUF1844 domain-containing protein [Acidobacteriota bacterium]
MAEEEEKPIRVVDRRMFTADGELRPEYRTGTESAPEPAAAPPSAAAPREPQAEPEPPPASAKEGQEPSGERPEAPRGAFSLIVQLLAMPAYAALGMVPDPASGRQRVDRAAAREMIDLLAVLEQKTRGNLSFEESNFLSRVLYDLRLAFVEVSRPPGK